jgi:peroxiredoxin
MDFERGIKAPSFSLRSTDDTRLNLSDLAGKHGTVVVFICNHCPYVVSALDDLNFEAQALQKEDIELIAICSNDPIKYPDDSFNKMQQFALQNAFNFPYLHDEDQSVARAYDAQCTPDFFGLNSALELEYRGRLNNRRDGAPELFRELYDAMMQIKETGKGPDQQFPSIGCSIKWAD